jgi:hypothetical protein
MSGMEFTTRLVGPLFTGALNAAVDRKVHEIEDVVAQRAVNMVQAQLSNVLQHPTGYYESKIRTDRVTQGVSVNDDMVIYGPWLEGVGSRNKTTRFKGYATFRLVGQRVNSEAVTLAEKLILGALTAKGGE